MAPKLKGKPSKGSKEDAPIQQKEKKSGKASKSVSEQSNLPPKCSKSVCKANKREIEENRVRERDEMMKIYDFSDEDGSDRNASDEDCTPVSKFTVDRFGNKISKVKLAEEKRVQAMREEARLRREQRGIGVSTSFSNDNGAGGVELPQGPNDVNIDLGSIHQKMSEGPKLTHKEKRILLLTEREDMENKKQVEETELGLVSFSLSVRGESTSAEEENLKCGSGTDIIVSSFTIAAPERPLLVDTSLRIVTGRKYGLLGPNGR